MTTASLGNTVNPPIATGVDQYVNPPFIGYAMRAPTSNDIANPGTKWQNNAVTPPVIYETTGAGIWIPLPTLPNIVTAAASPQTSNYRYGQVTFNGVNIAAGATQSFVINNTTIPANAVIQYSMVGATTGAALNIQSVTNVAGISSTIVVENGTGATTSTANITFTYVILN
jgi:hypothetical protein